MVIVMKILPKNAYPFLIPLFLVFAFVAGILLSAKLSHKETIATPIQEEVSNPEPPSAGFGKASLPIMIEPIPGEPYYMECYNNSCVYVHGEGENNCAVDLDCAVKEDSL